MKRPLLVAAVAIVAGCSQTAKEQFAYIDKVTLIEMPDDTYRIREHPKGDRLMVTPSYGTIVKSGSTQGLTLGLAGQLPPGRVHEAAAHQYMDTTGRAHCVLVSSSELMKPHWQVIFDCAGG